MIIVLLFSLVQVSNNMNPLPSGHGDAVWGMSVSALQKVVKVHKATPGSEYGYADHSEVNPEVYVRKDKDNIRYEYYFFRKKLYKIYIVYSRGQAGPQFYRDRIKNAVAQYGSPHSHYQEMVFGLPVIHTRWEDKRSILDIRSGAGFVYKVLLDQNVVKEKARIQQYKKAI